MNTYNSNCILNPVCWLKKYQFIEMDFMRQSCRITALQTFSVEEVKKENKTEINVTNEIEAKAMWKENGRLVTKNILGMAFK